MVFVVYLGCLTIIFDEAFHVLRFARKVARIIINLLQNCTLFLKYEF
jgi:hypothetical protein